MNTAPDQRRAMVDIQTIVGLLHAQMPALCDRLGLHGQRKGPHITLPNPMGGPGKVGSFFITQRGPKAGMWKDFSGGEWGDALDLIARLECAGSKSEAIRWARQWLGIDAADPALMERKRAEVAQRAAVVKDQADAEELQKRAGAQRMWLAAQPVIAGTPVDAYLRGRGIDLSVLPRQPRALRYHPDLWNEESQRKWPALVTAVTDAAGDHVSTHRVWLEVQRDGRVTKAPLEKPKMVLAGYAGACIRLWKGASNKSLRHAPPGETVDITEGIEDGLSVVVSAPEYRVLAAISLSNMSGIELPPAITTVRLWRQRDTSNAAIRAADRAVQAHVAAGRTVLLPEIPAAFKDVNDLLRGVRA